MQVYQTGPQAGPQTGGENGTAERARRLMLTKLLRRPVTPICALETMRELPYREIAQELTNRNIPTPRGGDLWNAMTVMRSMRRLGLPGK